MRLVKPIQREVGNMSCAQSLPAISQPIWTEHPQGLPYYSAVPPFSKKTAKNEADTSNRCSEALHICKGAFLLGLWNLPTANAESYNDTS